MNYRSSAQASSWGLGVGTMGAMLIVGRLTGRLDTRSFSHRLGLTAWSFYAMTGWTPDISQTTIIVVG